MQENELRVILSQYNRYLSTVTSVRKLGQGWGKQANNTFQETSIVFPFHPVIIFLDLDLMKYS